MRRRQRKEAAGAEEKVISKADLMKRLGACCGIAGFLLACLAALLNYREHLQTWQVKLLGTILIVCIILILAYGSVWHWIYNACQKANCRMAERK